jgi:mxaA protein
MKAFNMKSLNRTSLLKSFFAPFLVLTIGIIFAPVNSAEKQGASQTGSNSQSKNKLKVSTQLRELGYSIGDIADQTLTITTPLGYVFDKGSLPAIGANSSPVELVSVDVKEKDVKGKDGQASTQHTVHLRWQHFRSTPEIRYYPLKPLNLKFSHENKKTLAITIAAGQILVAPTIPTVISGDAYKNLRPDVKPEKRNLTQHFIWLGLLITLAAACLAYLAWYFDWFNWQLGRLRPFRKAYREIKKLSKTKQQLEKANTLSAAMRALRHGFDGVAGSAISAENLSALFHAKNWLTPAKKDIESFFADSERVFFAGQPSTLTFQLLRKLSQQLMQLESAVKVKKSKVCTAHV